MNKLLELNNISFIPRKNSLLTGKDSEKIILNDISFDVMQGEILGIVGESGSGKTTLAKVIAGLLNTVKGEVKSNIKTGISVKRNPIQILFQNNDEIINPLRSVKDTLTEINKSDEHLKKICEIAGIPGSLFEQKGMQLSGGERQRVALARLLTVKPKVLILDEPFSAQDPESRSNFVSIFKNINSEFGITIICVSHNIRILELFTDRIAVMFGGKIMEIGGTENIFSNPLHPYTKFLLSAENFELKREDILGENLDRESANYACPYFERCPAKLDECKTFVNLIDNNNQLTYCNNPK